MCASSQSTFEPDPFLLTRSALQSPIAVVTQMARRYCVFAEAIVE
jgi:hypothetical protein